MNMEMPGVVYSERLAELISQQQYLRPHQPVEQALASAGQDVGLCPGAAKGAMNVLGIDAFGKIGRLRRSELIQLARTICRIWRQNVADHLPESRPA